MSGSESESGTPSSSSGAQDERRSEPQDPGRRNLLQILTGGVFALLGAALAAPAALLAVAPLRKRTVAGGEDPIAVADLAHLPEGVPVSARVIAPALVDAWAKLTDVALGAVWLVRRGERVTCLSSSCPHAGCFVDYEPAARQFRCPCHGSAFDLDGETVSGPSPRPMDALPCELKSGQVLVRFRRYKQATSAKEEV